METLNLQITNLDLIEQWEKQQDEEYKRKLAELEIKFNTK